MTIKQKQCLLTYLGYYTGSIDGLWGEKSRAATESFQRDYLLTVDGAFGDGTAQKIREVVASGELPADRPQAGADWWKEIRYFTRKEFRCPCGKCGGFPVEPKEALVRFLDEMREYFGKPIIVVPADGHSGGSGVRCAAYNTTLSGSVSNSTHLQGRAADFSIPGVPESEIMRYLITAKSEGKIAYWYKITSGSFHVNI